MKANISGTAIKHLRKQHNWSQIELAAALNVDHEINIDRSDISEIERGVRGVKDFELKAISNVLGVTADQLLGSE
jgi:transcriptional regulator with XRE-family HTH domain